MQFLKADTAVKVLIGPVVAVGDGFTPVATLSLSTADEAEIIKHDAAAVTDIASNTFAAIASADGYYNLTITAAQVDTEGMLTVLINDDSLCLPVKSEFMVVPANVYDSLFSAAGTDILDVSVTQWLGTAPPTPTTAGVPEVDVTYWDGLAVPTIATQTDIGNEVDTRLQGMKLDHLVAVADADDPVNNSIMAKLASATGDWSTFVAATDSLEAIANAGGGDATAANQTTIINALGTIENLGGGATVGQNFRDLAGATFSTSTDSNEALQIQLAIVETDTTTDIPALIAALNNFNPASDAVATVTTLTNLPAIPTNWITAAGLAGDAVNQIVDTVWEEAQASHVSAGSFGEIATEIATLLTRCSEIRLAELDAANLPTDVAAVNTIAAAIQATTNQFVFTVTNQVDANMKSVNDVVLQGTGVLGDEWKPV